MNLPQLKEDLRGIRETIRKFNIIQKCKNIFAVALFLTVMPFPYVANKPQQTEWITRSKIDVNTQSVLVLNKKVVDIKIGESEYSKKEKERIAKQTSKAKKVQLAVPKAYAQEPAPAEFKKLYQDAGAAYGVPWQILEAVHQVESGKSGSTSRSSYAGATGPMQFLPSTWNHYGIDGNGDGSADISNVNDAVYGAANYLAAGGAADGNVGQALLNYNHSSAYVNKVLGIASELGYNN